MAFSPVFYWHYIDYIVRCERSTPPPPLIYLLCRPAGYVLPSRVVRCCTASTDHVVYVASNNTRQPSTDRASREAHRLAFRSSVCWVLPAIPAQDPTDMVFTRALSLICLV